MGHTFRSLILASAIFGPSFGKPLRLDNRAQSSQDLSAGNSTSISSTASGPDAVSSTDGTSNMSGLPTSAPPVIPSNSTGTATPIEPNQPGFAEVNPKNRTCMETKNLTLHFTQYWTTVGGNDVMKFFDDMYSSDARLCDPCFGKKKEDCHSSEDDCTDGIRSSSNERYDVAMNRFTIRNPIPCSIDNDQCSATDLECEKTAGPAAWAIRLQMANLHQHLKDTKRKIQQAHDTLQDHMSEFSKTFAPLPNLNDAKLIDTIFGDVIVGILGAIPEIGAIAGAVGSTVKDAMMSTYDNQSEQPDTASIFGHFTEVVIDSLTKIHDDLFIKGKYTLSNSDGSETERTMLEIFESGSYMQLPQEPEASETETIAKYKKILLQPTLLYTWTNLQSDHVSHYPVIVFDNKPCDKVDPADEKGLAQVTLDGSKPFDLVNKMDVGVTVDDSCYYLIDVKPHAIGGDQNAHPTKRENAAASYDCNKGIQAFPAGTNKDLDGKSKDLGNLKLDDFIIPAVRGWQQNKRRNDYSAPPTDERFNLTSQSPGAVKIPVCDYIGSASYPGGGCPKLGPKDVSGSPPKCDLTDFSGVPNDPGTFKNGWCRLHFVQYQRREGDVNPLDDYQLSVEIHDDASRVIGQAPKQANGHPIEIGDSSLPFHLFAASGTGDEEPVSFWYGDQFWNSSSSVENQCSTGVWEGGSRQGDCGFRCPNSAAVATKAIDAHPLPTDPVRAVGGPTPFSNTWAAASTWVAPTAAPTAPAAAQPTGWCAFHLRQWQKWQDADHNPTSDYQIEVTLRDATDKVVGTSGKIPAPEGVPVTVRGLAQPFNVTARGHDEYPMDIAYGTLKFDTYSEANKCATGAKFQGYEDGKRDFDCGFSC